MKRGTGNPWRRLRLPARVGWLVAGVYTLGAALVVASSVWGWEGAYATRPVDEIGQVLCLLFAAACAGYAARFAVGRRRIGWLAMVTALLGWAVGEIIWAVYDVRPDLEHATHPAAAEVVSSYGRSAPWRRCCCYPTYLATSTATGAGRSYRDDLPVRAIALCPDHCDHPQDLLSRAETAIAHAQSAMSKIAVYESAFEAYRDNDPNFIGDLRTALFDGDQPALHYQPKINASDGSIHSVEALLRWYHPTRGVLLPEEFLPAAERAGLMRMLSDRTLKLALKQIRSWRDRGIVSSVAVNLATTNLLDLELVGTIERLLLTEGLPPDALIIEITESALVDSVRSRNTVAELRLLGVRISLDDYGTGWSSLARLQDVSVDELKLDRIFVARLVHDARSVAIVRSTVALADSLGADLVAEGVEDEVTLSALRRFGCTITQGYVHSPPLPPERLEHWASSHVPQANSSLPEQAEISD